MPYRILIVDDDARHLKVLSGYLNQAFASVKQAHYPDGKPKIHTSSDAQEVVNGIHQEKENYPYDIIIADVFMPLDPGKDASPHVGGGAIRIYNALKETEVYKQVFLVVMTNLAFDAAEELRKIDADHKTYDDPWMLFYQKPKTISHPKSGELLDNNDWVFAVEQAIRNCKNAKWKKTFVKSSLGEIVGNSAALNTAKIKVAEVANEQTVLIFGETGSGKELIARAIHENSERSGKPYRPVNSNSIGVTYTEVQVRLFGCVKGAYTDVDASMGIFEQALDGTVFFDEFGSDMDSGLENTRRMDLLMRRFLIDGKFHKVGGSEELQFTGTIIFGGSKLENLLASDRIPSDLKRRLSGKSIIVVPPLRDRGQDIILLAEYLMAKACTQKEIPLKSLSREVRTKMLEYPWPENIGELEDVINGLVKVLKLKIDIDDLPPKILECPAPATQRAEYPDTTPEQVLEALKKNEGNESKTACSLLGVNKETSSTNKKGAARSELRKRIKSYRNDPVFEARYEPIPKIVGRPKKK